MLGTMSALTSPLLNVSKSNTAESSALEHAEMREDTAIQRAVADMKSAGINPILGFSGAGAASSAAGASDVSAQAQIKAQKIAGIVSIVSSALGLAGAAMTGKK